MGEGKEPKKKYVVFYRIGGKPQGLTKRGFLFQLLFGCALIACVFAFYPISFGLIISGIYIPFFLTWWGIGRHNANKLERGGR